MRFCSNDTFVVVVVVAHTLDSRFYSVLEIYDKYSLSFKIVVVPLSLREDFSYVKLSSGCINKTFK